jgi:hypothetical protein
VPEQLVLAQLVSGQKVPHALGAVIGGAHPRPRRPGGFSQPGIRPVYAREDELVPVEDGQEHDTP